MLTEEYETMAEIQKMIDMAEEKIREDFNAGADFEQKPAKAKSEIREIYHNIGVVITEQRDLIINRHSLTDLYIDTIKKSFEFSFEKRYDFEETILMQLERYTNVLDNCLSLLKPFLLPDIGRFMCRISGWEADRRKLLVALISYSRKQIKGNEVFRRREESKVLIMDNPFGPITSEHLLKPMFEIAKKYKPS